MGFLLMDCCWLSADCLEASPARRLNTSTIGTKTCTMTRRPPTLAAPREPDKLALLRPLRPQRNLTEEAVARLTAEIRNGRLPPGARLPTEQVLMQAMG